MDTTKLKARLEEMLAKERMPRIQLLRARHAQHLEGVFAQRIRAEILTAQ